MTHQIKMGAVLAAVAMLSTLTACGNGGGNGSQAAAPTDESLLVADASALPACTPANEDRLVYVKTQSQFQACSAGAWSVVSINGATGPTGAAGPTGTVGVGEKIVSSLHCGATLPAATAASEGLAIPASGATVSYDAAITNSGDVFATAEIATDAAQVGATQFYAATQTGASVASVLINDDAALTANFGYWNIYVDRTTNVATADYHDPEVSGGVSKFTFPATDCKVNRY